MCYFSARLHVNISIVIYCPLYLEVPYINYFHFLEGADLKFSSHVHCRQAFYWAVNIDAFYAIIHLSWSDFVEKFSTSNSLFYDCSLQCEVVPEMYLLSIYNKIYCA